MPLHRRSLFAAAMTAIVLPALVPSAHAQTPPTIVHVRGTIASVAPDSVVVKTKSGDIRVAATGASQSGVMRLPAIETALKANWSAGALDSVKISADGLMSDIQGSSDYRANLIKVMAQRAVTAAG